MAPIVIYAVAAVVISILLLILLLILLIQRRRQRVILLMSRAQEEANRRRRKRNKSGLHRWEIDATCPEALVVSFSSSLSSPLLHTSPHIAYINGIDSLHSLNLLPFSPSSTPTPTPTTTPALPHNTSCTTMDDECAGKNVVVSSSSAAIISPVNAADDDDTKHDHDTRRVSNTNNNTTPSQLPQHVIVLPTSCEMCVICIESIDKGQRVRALPCAHVYHSQCIRMWLRRRNACPCCADKVIKRRSSSKRDPHHTATSSTTTTTTTTTTTPHLHSSANTSSSVIPRLNIPSTQPPPAVSANEFDDDDDDEDPTVMMRDMSFREEVSPSNLMPNHSFAAPSNMTTLSASSSANLSESSTTNMANIMALQRDDEDMGMGMERMEHGRSSMTRSEELVMDESYVIVFDEDEDEDEDVDVGEVSESRQRREEDEESESEEESEIQPPPRDRQQSQQRQQRQAQVFIAPSVGSDDGTSSLPLTNGMEEVMTEATVAELVFRHRSNHGIGMSYARNDSVLSWNASTADLSAQQLDVRIAGTIETTQQPGGARRQRHSTSAT